MGFENTTPLSVVAYDSETGERVTEFDLASCPDIACETITADGISCDRIDLDKISFEMVFEFRWPRCSRKRFVKKLMGIGIPRNVANWYAKMCAVARIPYGEAYHNIIIRRLIG